VPDRRPTRAAPSSTSLRWRARPRSAGSSKRPLTRLAAAAALIALAAAATASAHGDPAGHYLETESLYPGFADRPSPSLELALLGHLQAAEDRGYPIKVALVAASEDLSDNAELLRDPQQYAELAASEFGLDAPVVVVSPHGVGVARPELAGALRGVDVPRRADGDDLARTAMVAVRRLAAAAGHPLPARVPPAAALRASPSSDDESGVNVPLIVGLFVLVFAPSVLFFEVWTRRRR
jgi:hypothetical protein